MNHIRVPVINPDGTPAMPTKPSRARRWVREGKAVGRWSDLGVYYVQLHQEPSGYQTQPIYLGIDPGKSFSGFGVQSARSTLFRGHAILPFHRVKKRMGTPIKSKQGKVIKKAEERHRLRRTRRGRRINRQVPFEQRAHRQQRFDNRRQSKIAPSIKASRQLEIRIAKELYAIYPIASIVYELVKADVDLTSGRKGARVGTGFSPVMVGQNWAVKKLAKLAPVETKHGWQKDGNGTSQLREHLGLYKDKQNKDQAIPETHAVDGVALACSQFVSYRPFWGSKERGHRWEGEVTVTDSLFKVISRPGYYRRQLHFEKPIKGGIRKRKGGTTTPFGYRAGDYVEAEKAGVTYRGWIGGYTDTAKSKKLSVYDAQWHRISQFALSKVKLLRRSNKLCIA